MNHHHTGERGEDEDRDHIPVAENNASNNFLKSQCQLRVGAVRQTMDLDDCCDICLRAYANAFSISLGKKGTRSRAVPNDFGTHEEGVLM